MGCVYVYIYIYKNVFTGPLMFGLEQDEKWDVPGEGCASDIPPFSVRMRCDREP